MATKEGGPRVTLNDGRELPVIGLGTWKTKPDEVEAAVVGAVWAGYRHIDCAPTYANELEVGAALKKIFSTGDVKREDLWITSKLWNSKHSAKDVSAACKKSLADLGLEYLDLYLIHWPVVQGCTGDVLEPSIQETWGAMEQLQADGLVRSIGVSNFSAKKLADMKAYAKVLPAVNQVELHPLWQQEALLAAARDCGACHLTAYSPLGSSDSDIMMGHGGSGVLHSEVVKTVARLTGKTPAQVVLRWAVQRGTSIIPKSVQLHHIQANIEIFNWQLNEEMMISFGSIRQRRRFSGEFLVGPETPYKSTADLWDE